MWKNPQGYDNIANSASVYIYIYIIIITVKLLETGLIMQI